MLNEKMYNFENAANKLRCDIKFAASEDIDNMDDNSFRTLQSVLRFMDASTELIIEQTKVISNMEKKIEEILSKVKAD